MKTTFDFNDDDNIISSIARLFVPPNVPDVEQLGADALALDDDAYHRFSQGERVASTELAAKGNDDGPTR